MSDPAFMVHVLFRAGVHMSTRIAADCTGEDLAAAQRLSSALRELANDIDHACHRRRLDADRMGEKL